MVTKVRALCVVIEYNTTTCTAPHLVLLQQTATVLHASNIETSVNIATCKVLNSNTISKVLVHSVVSPSRIQITTHVLE